MTVEVMELDVSGWLNGGPVDLSDLRGRVVVVEAFQMLCPGCVKYGIPQTLRVHRTFSRDQVVVIGLHTVFEHHAVMGPDALEVFLAEFGIDFPIAIDRQQEGPIPATMQRYHLQGTPTTLLLDRMGQIRYTMFGEVEDLVLGARIAQLLAEVPAEAAS